MKKLTKKQIEIINKIENLLNISILSNCSFLKNKFINLNSNLNQDEKRNFINFLNANLKKYNFCSFENNGGFGIAIILK